MSLFWCFIGISLLTVHNRHVYIFFVGSRRLNFACSAQISTTLGCFSVFVCFLFFKLEMYCSDDTLYRPTYKSGQYGSASAYYTHKTYDIAKRTTKGRGHSIAFFFFSEEVRPFKKPGFRLLRFQCHCFITAQAEFFAFHFDRYGPRASILFYDAVTLFILPISHVYMQDPPHSNINM